MSKETVAVARGGQKVEITRLAAAGTEVRPAWLIVAGVDPRHGGSTAVATAVGELIRTEHAAALAHADLYVLSQLNPGGIAAATAAGAWNATGRNRSEPKLIDADRDGRYNEDPPTDLDGDGRVMWMRVKDPAPKSGLHAEYVLEESDPRLMRRADPSKAERPVYALLPESRDADGDGLFGEDGFEGVELDRNFPYHWPEYRDEAGRVPLSEPETRGLAQWLLKHPNIVGILEYAPGDTLVNVPPGGKMDETGEAPATNHVLDADRGTYERIGEKFREITHQKEAPARENFGTLQGWGYAQLGVWSFSTPVWVRPDQLKVEKKKEDKKDGDDKKEPAAEAKQPERKRVDSEDGKWMALSDAMQAAGKPGGFVDWKPFKHPQLGDVEIGGFVPAFRVDVPESEVPRLAAEQATFVADLLERSPRLEIQPPAVERLGESVWRISVRAVNEGKLPTRTAMGVKTRRLPPSRWSVGVERSRILAGERSPRAEAIAAGGEFVASWTVSGTAGEKIALKLSSPDCGEKTVEVSLGGEAKKEAQP